MVRFQRQRLRLLSACPSVLLVGVAILSLCGCARIRPPRGAKYVVRTMMTTGYCKCGSCCGWKRTWYGRPVYKSGRLKGKRKKVGFTATNVRAHHGTIAADTSRYPFGTIMYVEGYGYGRVEDRGGAIKGEHIDLYFRSHSEALDWGRRRKKVKVWFVR
ncbi:MAG: 3D domain-containing protein [Kiritimatiellia bacterium]|nr:3D domain-containing protein [Kiritimatiellia bacterium]MDP6629370.1 3D domain-containing protein [Kiritimatiellia bacterium]MDP6811353.1 3D domain-containing protein [Kiritimatiellia bacterium]MDP7024394.1 3D domain-containing protein [Kiritimatiellia bacterium]